MEMTKVVKPFIRMGWPNTFGNIVYIGLILVYEKVCTPFIDMPQNHWHLRKVLYLKQLSVYPLATRLWQWHSHLWELVSFGGISSGDWSCDLLAERILNGLMHLKRTVKYPAFNRAFNSGNVKFSKRIQFDTVKSWSRLPCNDLSSGQNQVCVILYVY